MLGKFGKKIALAVLAGISGLVVTGTTAQAGSVVLGNSGWTASWDSKFDPYLQISTPDYETQDAVYIEKFVNFTNAFNDPAGFIDPAVVTFQATRANATPYIVINDEQLVNNTGKDWNAFRMSLLPSDGSVSFNPALSDINPPGSGFDIHPFTNFSFSLNNTILDTNGGVVADGAVWFPGSGPGSLVINTNAGQLGCDAAFTLKEQPLAIPLPAAAWSGLSGLVGLALVGSRKKLRQLVA